MAPGPFSVMLENDEKDAPVDDDGVNCSMRLMSDATRVGRDGDGDAPAPPLPTAAGDE